MKAVQYYAGFHVLVLNVCILFKIQFLKLNNSFTGIIHK